MRRAVAVPAFVLLVLLLAGAGWWLFRGEEEAPGRAPASDAAAHAARLNEALSHLKAADDAKGTRRDIELAEARRRLDELVERAPLEPQARFWRAVAAVMGHDEAVARADQARIRDLPTGPDRESMTLYLEAIITNEFRPDDPAPGLRALRNLRAKDPAFLREPVERALYRNLQLCTAYIVAQPQRAEEAVPYAEEAARLVEGDPAREAEARRFLADAYARAGRYIEAVDVYEALLKQPGGETADNHAAIASLHAMQNQWSRAVEQYDRAVALAREGKITDPTDPLVDEMTLRRANCLRMLDRPKEALADLEAYLKIRPQDHRAHFWIGMLYMEALEQPEKAKEHLELARTSAPYCESYLRALVALYEQYLPDPVRAEAVRKEIDEGAKAREEEMKRLRRKPGRSRFLCE